MFFTKLVLTSSSDTAKTGAQQRRISSTHSVEPPKLFARR
jgi:hypothetical protein